MSIEFSESFTYIARTGVVGGSSCFGVDQLGRHDGS